METSDKIQWPEGSVFRKLAEVGLVSNLSKEDRIKYDAALRHYRDTLNAMQGAEDKGLKKGLAIGEEKGLAIGLAIGEEKLERQKREFAKKLMIMGCSYKMIMEVTGLSEEEMTKL
jgi:predicted transposase/invertase (TIGR01784 family)